MQSQEATKALTAAGQAGEVKELLTREADDAARRYRQIREDDTLTEDAKRSMLATAYVQKRRGVDKKLDEMASRVCPQRPLRCRASLRREGSARRRGQPHHLAPGCSRPRGHHRRPGRTPRPFAPCHPVRRRGLARAIADRAVDNLDDRTLHQFAADRPDLDTPVGRPWNARRAENASFFLTTHFLALRPHELAGMTSDTIEGLAEAGSARRIA